MMPTKIPQQHPAVHLLQHQVPYYFMPFFFSVPFFFIDLVPWTIDTEEVIEHGTFFSYIWHALSSVYYFKD